MSSSSFLIDHSVKRVERRSPHELSLTRYGAAYLIASMSLGLVFFKGPVANVLLAIVLLSLLLAGTDVFRARLLAPDWMYLAYIAVILASATWSLSAIATIEQAIPLLVPWLAAIALHSLQLEWTAGAFIKLAAVAAIASPAMILVDRRLAYQPRSSTGAPELRGLFAHQQFLGAFMAMAVGIVVISYLNSQKTVVGKTRLWRISIVLLLVVMLGLSRARLYILVAAICLLLTCMISRRGSRKWITLNIIAIVAVTISVSFTKIVDTLKSVGFDTTLTGRTDVWAISLRAIDADTQWAGYGFGTFQLPTFDSLFGQWRPAHAHSSFVQAFFETGYVGLAILIILIIVQVASAWAYSIRADRYSYSLFLVLFCAFGSLTGGLIYAGALVSPFCIMMLFLAIEIRNSGDASTGANGSRRQIGRDQTPTTIE